MFGPKIPKRSSPSFKQLSSALQSHSTAPTIPTIPTAPVPRLMNLGIRSMNLNHRTQFENIRISRPHLQDKECHSSKGNGSGNESGSVTPIASRSNNYSKQRNNKATFTPSANHSSSIRVKLRKCQGCASSNRSENYTLSKF